MSNKIIEGNMQGGRFLQHTYGVTLNVFIPYTPAILDLIWISPNARKVMD